MVLFLVGRQVDVFAGWKFGLGLLNDPEIVILLSKRCVFQACETCRLQAGGHGVQKNNIGTKPAFKGFASYLPGS